MADRLAANSLSELGEVNGQIARLQNAIGALKAERDELIVALINNGFSEREIALAAGVSGPRINQIKKEATA